MKAMLLNYGPLEFAPNVCDDRKGIYVRQGEDEVLIWMAQSDIQPFIDQLKKLKDLKDNSSSLPSDLERLQMSRKPQHQEA